MYSGDRVWQEIEFSMRRRDHALTHCYLLGLTLGGVCLFLPYRLSQLGAVLMLVALIHMISRIYRAHHPRRTLDHYAEGHPRLALAESVLFNVPFLVGVNLVFMGLPLSQDPLQDARWECGFLAWTVALFVLSYCWNQRARRALEFCVGSKAVESSRFE